MADDPSCPNLPIQLTGQLLLADPALHGTTFRRAVVLLAEHSLEEGAYGLILNHPTQKTVSEFLPDEFFTPLHPLAVHYGGPVESDQLSFSSFWWSPKRGLRWALRISAEDAAAHSQRPGRIVRAFIGHSGWYAGQLETELRGTSWIAMKAKPNLLQQPHDLSLWASLLRSISPFHTILAAAPDDPSLN